ncbi:Cps1p [Sugiyamaella lignohabitans]|uniref:Cps1p n=1 Tax=Sugiyamaella lignohabitans TaxID=796027 RepID=A0A167D8L3_9ASCO|nr:Cps1p [Sugiyamaella lignohabitans]ANB12614.1 Cps1p [Sugiyamaella lignohabitans]
MTNEKSNLQGALLPTDEQTIVNNQSSNSLDTRRKANGRIAKAVITIFAIVCYIGFYCFKSGTPLLASGPSVSVSRATECPDVEKIIPSDQFASPEQFFTDDYKNFSIHAWAGAIKYPTVGYDDLKDIGEDDRWLPFGDLQQFLKETFPLTFSKLEVEHVNTYGLLLTLHGKDTSLKPVLLMAHQDVVPVPDGTLADWTYPPFSGHFDGEFVWGRGSSDDKNSLIGILEGIEALLKQGYAPDRGVILSFGFDEEVSGWRGAKNIASHLENKLGKDSIYMIIDEGGGGVQNVHGGWFGLLGTGEKGYLDVRVAITTSGGHSSIPPDHTSIGIISRFITELEDNPYEPDITRANPFYYNLQCFAEKAPEIDAQFKADIQNIEKCPAAKKRVIDIVEQDFLTKYVIRTSQAADVINGGIKINALPEQVSVDLNHRIAIESSVDFVKENIVSKITALAKRFEFNVKAFGENILDNANSKGLFEVTSLSELSPAPVTPISNNPTWDLLGGTVRQVFEDVNGGIVDSPIAITPSIMTANTDTRHYWNLTKNIYRFTPIANPFDYNIHTVDEHTSVDGHLKAVAFYYNFLRNVDTFN